MKKLTDAQKYLLFLQGHDGVKPTPEDVKSHDIFNDPHSVYTFSDGSKLREDRNSVEVVS